MMRNLLTLALLACTLLACRPAGDRADSSEALSEAGATGAAPARGGGDPVIRGAEKATAETLPDNLATAEGNPAAPTNTAASPAVGEEQGDTPGPAIPAAYRGRWGMVAADCTSTRGDNKGLITIGERTIKFYEATATLSEQRPAIATSFSGLFNFTGEGMNWTKVQTLTRIGDSLTRAEHEGTFRYSRCPG